jgi:deazaflavin-dependent oxidoreductase (nitroreductase family)
MSDFNQALIDQIRANQGQVIEGYFAGRQVLILTTTGAKSGETRESPLAYSRDANDLVIVASMGGAPTHPSWYHNLVANPRVKVEANGETFEADAIVVDPDERRRLYDQHADLHASFKDYEGLTSRVIPVIRLKRRGSAVAAA